MGLVGTARARAHRAYRRLRPRTAVEVGRQLQGQAVARDPSIVTSDSYRRARAKYIGKLHVKSRTGSRVRQAIATELAPRKRSYYELDAYDESLYVNDVEYAMTAYINGEYRWVLKNKLLSYQVLGNYVRIPKVYLLTIRGKVEVEDAELAALVAASEPTPLFVKPLAASGGKGAERITVHDGLVELSDGSTLPWAEYVEAIKARGDTFVQGLLRQSEFADGLYPGSINTMRVLTMRDPVTREPFVCRVVQRVGTDVSAPVDNYYSGGISFDVDLETGVIGTGYPKKSRTRTESHPDTGAPITGQVIPDFATLLEETLRLHRLMPYLDYAAWDLCHAQDGGVIMVEGNATSDVGVFQVHRPLLLDERAVAFYRYHHIL